MIVIDIGCAAYGGDESIPYLIEEFKPEFLYGFDPSAKKESYELNGTRVLVRPWAAWTSYDTVTFQPDGLRGRITVDGTRVVGAFDLADWILSTPVGDPETVLKMDAEGSEYTLLPHLIKYGADLRLKLAWVEWHCPVCGTGWFSADDRCGRCEYHEPGKRSDLEASMRCEMHQWNR